MLSVRVQELWVMTGARDSRLRVVMMQRVMVMVVVMVEVRWTVLQGRRRRSHVEGERILFHRDQVVHRRGGL